MPETISDSQTFPKKRLSIIIETPFLSRLEKILQEDAKVGAYTVFPAMAGAGRSGCWSRDTQSSDAGTMVQVVVVLDESHLPAVLRPVREVLDKQIGILTLTDVEVLRPELFVHGQEK